MRRNCKVMLLALLCFFALSLYAQPDSVKTRPAFQMGLGITGYSYIGDFSQDFQDLYRINPGGNLSLQTTGPVALSLQANVGFGSIAEQLDSRSPIFSSDAARQSSIESNPKVCRFSR